MWGEKIIKSLETLVVPFLFNPKNRKSFSIVKRHFINQLDPLVWHLSFVGCLVSSVQSVSLWGLACSVNKYLNSLRHSGDPNIAYTRAQTVNSSHFLPKKSRLPNRLLCRQRPKERIKKFTPYCRFVTLLW